MSAAERERKARRTLAGRFARAVVALRWPIVIGWVAAAVASSLFLPTIREAQVGSLGDLVPNDAEAIETERRAVELFGFPVLSRTLVVHRDADGLSLAQQAEAVSRALALNRDEIPGLEDIGGALVTTNTLGEPPFSRESSTTAITYLYFAPEIGQTARTELARQLANEEIEADPRATAGVTGAVPARAAQSDAIQGALPLVEGATILLVGLAVGLHFRAIGAPLLNLLTVGIAYLTAIRVIAYIGQAVGISVPSEVEPVIVVLLFGVITDYSIFFMSRFRQVAVEGEGRRRAAERATRELLPIVVTAGSTIVAGSAMLVLAQLGFLQAFGPGMALSVGVGLLVAITFVPAALSIFGTGLFWPGKERESPADEGEEERGSQGEQDPRARAGHAAPAGDDAQEPNPRRRERGTGRLGLGAPLRRPVVRHRSPFRRRQPRVDTPPRRSRLPFRRPRPRVNLPRGRRSIPIELASRWPLTVAVLSAAVLLAAASGLSRLDPANPLIRGLPEDSPVKEAYAAGSEGFVPGILAPTVVLVEGEGITDRPAALTELQRLLGAQPGVAEVVGPADQPLEREFGAVLSDSGDAARYVAVLNADPLGGKAIQILRDLQARAPALLDRAGLDQATVRFAGDTALAAETVEQTFDDLAAISPVIALVVLLILALFLRALVAPLYLLLASVLALCASLGLTVYVFQELLGYGEITYYVPFASAVLLVALGSDYNVFLVGRVWYEARERPIREAIVTGGASAARPITAAGLVLAGSFALLAIVPVRSFRELGFTMAVGLLLDAFIVRTLLVPALMSIAGRWSAWPSRRLFRVGPADR